MAKQDKRKVGLKKPIVQQKDNTNISKPYIKTPTKPLLTQKEEQKRLAIVEGQNKQGIIYPTKKQGKISKAWDVLSHPATALELGTKGHIPDNFVKGMDAGNVKRNNLDMATDVINPIAMIDYASGLPKAIKEGNYEEAILRGASMLPMVKAIKSTIKSIPKNTIPTSVLTKYNAPTIPYREQKLAKELHPYLSRYEKPISREQEVFESFLSPEEVNKRVNARTVHLDNKGKIIPAPKDYDKFIKQNNTPDMANGGSLIQNNNMKTVKKTKAIPKHFWGAVLGSAVSIGSTLLQNAKQKKEELAAAREQYSTGLNQQRTSDTLALDEFKEKDGVGLVDYYQAKGGKLATPVSYNTKGGKLQPLSSDMEVAKGNKHSESKIDNTSGIKLIKGNKPFAEIEDGETIKDGVKVYSDRLTVDGKRTYAEVAEKLGKQKGKLEIDMKSDTGITRNTKKRQLAGLDKAEDLLFAKQEASKTSDNTTKLEKGGFAKVAGEVVPYLDNIGNALLTKSTPKIPKPKLIQPEYIKTTYNANPELAAVSDAVAASTKSIQENTSNSAAARNAISATRLEGAKQTGKILANKENIETGLVNQSASNRQNVNAANTATLNDYSNKKLARLDDIQGRISANIANVAGDFIDKRNFDATEDYQKEQLQVIRDTYDTKGTSNRADLNNKFLMESLKNNKAEAEKVYNTQFKGTDQEDAFIALMGWKPRVNTIPTKQLAIPNLKI